jgi:hypothetical protein
MQMSSRDNKNGNNRLKEFMYIVALLFLIACLGGIYFLSRKQNEEEKQKLEAIIASEQEPTILNAKLMSDQIYAEDEADEASSVEEGDVSVHPETSDRKDRTPDSESSKDSGNDAAHVSKDNGEADHSNDVKDQTEKVQTADADSAQEGAVEKTEGESVESQEPSQPKKASGENQEPAQPEEESGEKAEETASEEPSDFRAHSDSESGDNDSQDQAASEGDLLAGVKAQSVVVLNGTYKNGVAAFWGDQLRNDGYTNLFTGSYSGRAEQETVIYTDHDKAEAAVFADLFSGAEIRDFGQLGPYEISEGGIAPEHCDFYIVIGTADAAV